MKDHTDRLANRMGAEFVPTDNPLLTANEAAAHLMQHLWGCDITTHPHYEYGKSGAQAYAEIRIAAEREEDTAITKARGSQP